MGNYAYKPAIWGSHELVFRLKPPFCRIITKLSPAIWGSIGLFCLMTDAVFLVKSYSFLMVSIYLIILEFPSLQ